MEPSVEDPSRTRSFLERYSFFILSLGYLLLAFKLLPDYGLGFDSPKNFDEGQINLNFLLTGHTALLDQFSLSLQIHGAFFFMLSELCKRFLSDGCGWLDPVSAHHVLIPILVFFFINSFYIFLKKWTNSRTAFLTCALLLTAPHFFGQIFNNIKDIPLFVFFSITMFNFYEWHASGFRKRRYLYGTFIAGGLALISKLYALLIPILLLLWLLVLRRTANRKKEYPTPTAPRANTFWTPSNLFHSFVGLDLASTLLALFFMPAFYPIQEKMIFLEMKGRAVKQLMQHGTQNWSFYPLIQVFYITPVLTLVMAILGLIKTLFQKPLTSLSALMLTLFFVVMAVACTPIFPVYNGIRLFMVYLLPFCFFAIAGITCTAELIEKISPVKKTWAVWILGLVLIAAQISGIAATHPYETTFFNRLAGGLKGAQKKHIPDAADYWLVSYREAMRWINRNAPRNALLWLPNSDGIYMIRYYFIRTDLKYDFIKQTPLPRNSFLIITPGKTCWTNVTTDMRGNIERETNRMAKIHSIRRQGGEILTIYYKP